MGSTRECCLWTPCQYSQYQPTQPSQCRLAPALIRSLRAHSPSDRRTRRTCRPALLVLGHALASEFEFRNTRVDVLIPWFMVGRSFSSAERYNMAVEYECEIFCIMLIGIWLNRSNANHLLLVFFLWTGFGGIRFFLLTFEAFWRTSWCEYKLFSSYSSTMRLF